MDLNEVQQIIYAKSYVEHVKHGCRKYAKFHSLLWDFSMEKHTFNKIYIELV
jgi:hypothetical protein